MIIDRMLTRHKRERAQRNTQCVCVWEREREDKENEAIDNQKTKKNF